MRRKSTIAAAGAVLFITSTAHAQTDPGKALDRAEARLEHAERTASAAGKGLLLALDGGPVPEKHWTLELDLPFTFNSNVANAETGTDQAFHGAPGIALSGLWSLDKAKTISLFVEGDVDLDAYTSHDDNDSSDFRGQIGFRFGDKKRGIAPYVHYTILWLYGGQFGPHQVTVHHFTIGAARKFALAGDRTLSIDVNVLRREATLATVEQDRGSVSLAYGQLLGSKLSASLGGTVQYIHYTGGASNGRDDVNVKISIGLSRDITDSIALAAGIYFQQNWSNRVGKGYSTVDTGPVLTLSHSF